ncbi:MAG TPA: hypothetical protein VMX94_04130 [Armatimonadota bacterium]|nr:hypothetical protein [Armatimonadota bacterium]
MKAKQPVIHRLRFGIDIDGTITQAPKRFKRLIDALIADDDYVFIITGRDTGRRQETEEFLKSLRIRYHDLVMKPIDWPGTMPEWKVKAVTEANVQLMFDDEEANCWAIQQRTQCLAAHALPIPEMEEEFADLLRVRPRAKARHEEICSE